MSSIVDDAIGQTMTTAMESFIKLESASRPSGVTVTILTDGQENASNEYDYDKISALISKAQSDLDWRFVFLAASQDAIKAAGSIGVHARDAGSFDASPDGIHEGTDMMKTMTVSRRQDQKRRD